MKLGRALIGAIAVVLLTVPASAQDTSPTYYVSPTGSDTASGSLAHPWRTIGKANATIKAGETVVLRAGTYHERIEPNRSGREGALITYRGYKNEKAIITGGGDHGALLVKIDYITIDGIVFDGEDRIKGGVSIDDHADHITVRNCRIFNHRRASNTGGYGLRVGRKGASHLLVENCKIYRNGTTNPKRQEGGNVRIDGAADHIVIRGCDIYEAYSEDGLHMGAFGVVEDVLVEDCRFWNCKEDAIDIKRVERVTIRNCEFWGHRKSVTGGGAGVNIHQSATDVLVDRCRSWDNMRGIGIAYNLKSGKWPPTQRITVRRCVLFENDVGLLVVGGMPRKPVQGKCRDIQVHNNVFYANRNCGLELYAHKGGDVVGVDVKNNVFLKNEKVDFSMNRGVKKVSLERNCFADGRRVPAEDRHALRVDPKFKDVKNKDFTLTPNSPLKDKGVDVGLPFTGQAPDIGAFEYGEQLPAPATQGASKVRTASRKRGGTPAELSLVGTPEYSPASAALKSTAVAPKRTIDPQRLTSVQGELLKRAIEGFKYEGRSPENIFVTVFSRPARSKLVKLTTAGFVANAMGVDTTNAWQDTEPKRIYAILRHCLDQDSASDRYLLARYCAAALLDEQAVDEVRAVIRLDAELGERARALLLQERFSLSPNEGASPQ